MTLDPELVEQISAAMYGYAGASATATTLTPFSAPTQNSNLAGTGAQAAAVASAATGTPSAPSQLIPQVPSMLQSLASGGASQGMPNMLSNPLVTSYRSAPRVASQRRGGEMSQSPKTSAATPDVIQDAEPTLVKDGTSHAPVFITQQGVVFSTAVAMSSRPASISRRLIDAIRVVGAALRRPPARRHYRPRSSYLELSRMARELDRL
jgi:hypothetical protein